MVFFVFMLGVDFCRQKLKPIPKSDLTLVIGLEVWQISWPVILLNLFWYYWTIISPITRRPSAVVGLDGSARKPSLLKRCSLNLKSRSSARSSYSNISCRSFLNQLANLVFSFVFDLPGLPFTWMLFSVYCLSPFDVPFFRVLVLRFLLIGSAGWLNFLTFSDFPLYLDPFSVALDGRPSRPWHEYFFGAVSLVIF